MSDTPSTDAEVKRIYSVLDGDEDDAAYALDQMSVLCRQLERKLAEMRQQRDEAHGLIRALRVKNAVDIVNDGESMYAMTPSRRVIMNDSEKRAFLAAMRKQGGGA